MIFKQLLDPKKLGDILAASPIGIALQYSYEKDGSGAVFLYKLILGLRTLLSSPSSLKQQIEFLKKVQEENKSFIDAMNQRSMDLGVDIFGDLAQDLQNAPAQSLKYSDEGSTDFTRDTTGEDVKHFDKAASDNERKKLQKKALQKFVSRFKDFDPRQMTDVMIQCGMSSLSNLAAALRTLLDMYPKGETAAIASIKGEFIALVQCATTIDRHIPLCAMPPYIPVALPVIISNVVQMVEIIENLYLLEFFPKLRIIICILLKPIYAIFKVYNIVQGAINKLVDRLSRILPSPLTMFLVPLKRPLLPVQSPCFAEDDFAYGLCSAKLKMADDELSEEDANNLVVELNNLVSSIYDEKIISDCLDIQKLRKQCEKEVPRVYSFYEPIWSYSVSDGTKQYVREFWTYDSNNNFVLSSTKKSGATSVVIYESGGKSAYASSSKLNTSLSGVRDNGQYIITKFPSGWNYVLEKGFSYGRTKVTLGTTDDYNTTLDISGNPLSATKEYEPWYTSGVYVDWWQQQTTRRSVSAEAGETYSGVPVIVGFREIHTPQIPNSSIDRITESYKIHPALSKRLGMYEGSVDVTKCKNLYELAREDVISSCVDKKFDDCADKLAQKLLKMSMNQGTTSGDDFWADINVDDKGTAVPLSEGFAATYPWSDSPLLGSDMDVSNIVDIDTSDSGLDNINGIRIHCWNGERITSGADESVRFVPYKNTSSYDWILRGTTNNVSATNINCS